MSPPPVPLPARAPTPPAPTAAVAKEVVLRGTVIIVASEGARIDIPRGSVLENAVVTGNLRILEH